VETVIVEEISSLSQQVKMFGGPNAAISEHLTSFLSDMSGRANNFHV
jgi:hypothetical protein